LKLIIMRHGESPDNYDDFKRVLSNDGVLKVGKVVEKLKKNNYLPDFALISKADRTLETYNILKNNLKLSIAENITEKLYNCNIGDIIDFILNVDNSYSSVLIVGHNPSISRIIEILADKTFYLTPGQTVVMNCDKINKWEDLYSSYKLWDILNVF